MSVATSGSLAPLAAPLSDAQTASAPTPDPLDSMTAALVDANDRLLGLIKLVAVAGESLDETTTVNALLQAALPLLDADAAEFVGATVHRVGDRRGDTADYHAAVRRNDEEQELTVHVWRASSPFGTPERKLLDGVATLLRNAVRTARLHTEGLNQAIVAREHAAAARLTAAVLPDPSDIPSRAGIETFARLTPARTTGGDLYAWDLINGDLWFAVGDVSGKGLPAAVQMTTVMSAITGAFARHHQGGVQAVFEFVERMVFDNLSDAGMFVTLVIGRVLAHPRPASAFTLEIANAGHSPVVFATGATAERIAASAPPLGVLAGHLPAVTTLEVTERSALVIATDGFTEQESANGHALGENEFDRLVHELADAPAREIGDRLFDAVLTHGQDCDQSDDRTLMILSFTP